MSNGYVIVQRAKNGTVTDVWWHEDGDRLFTEAEARGYAKQDNEMEPDDGYRSIVAEVRELE